jgi:hypothetical protein
MHGTQSTVMVGRQSCSLAEPRTATDKGGHAKHPVAPRRVFVYVLTGQNMQGVAGERSWSTRPRRHGLHATDPLEEKVPAWQPMQGVDEFRSWSCCPAGHWSHLGVLLLQCRSRNMPGPQIRHPDMFLAPLLLKVPSGHTPAHCPVCPRSALKRPLSHRRHGVSAFESRSDLPGGQILH